MCRYARQRELVAETMPLTESSHTRIHRSDSICMMLFKKSSKPKQFGGGGLGRWLGRQLLVTRTGQQNGVVV